VNRANVRTVPRTLRVFHVMMAVTIVFSLLYAIQYFANSPLRIPVTTPLRSLSVSPNHAVIVAGAEDGNIYLWESDSWTKAVLNGHAGAVTHVAFAPDGQTLISSGADGTLRWWDIDRRRTVDTLQVSDFSLVDFSSSSDGRRLATIDEKGTVQVFADPNHERMFSISSNGNPTHALALSPDGSLLALGKDNDIDVYDAASGDLVQKLTGYWDDPEEQQDWVGHQDDITALAFSPDGELLASGSADTTINFWDLATGEVRWPSIGHWAAVTSMVFDADGGTMLSGGRDNKIRIWRLPGGKSTGIFEGHLGVVNGVAFGSEPGTIFTVGDDGTLRQWETLNQRVVRIDWSKIGLQPLWGSAIAAWFLGSGLLGAVAYRGLRRMRPWSYLLLLATFLIGVIVVFGLPLLEVLTYPLSWGLRLQTAWPLLGLSGWYIGLLAVTMRERVFGRYQAPAGLALSDQLVASQRTAQLRFLIQSLAVWVGVLVLLFSLLRRFNLDVAFMGHFFPFIMQGAGMTVVISAASILLAIVLALFGAVGRLSRNPIASGISSFYVSLIRGTPLLVQVYIWYLGLPRLDIVLPAVTAGILALGVNYGAYMTETFRAGIQAIGKGQHEAAQALGMTRGQTLRRIVLPQAFRIVIPPIGNDFIAMMKDSSLVSVMAVWELTYRAQKIGRQNFRNMETFIIAAGFYWVLTVIFQALQGKLEDYMGRGERK
jgi:polar amino acid transport system permease protein